MNRRVGVIGCGAWGKNLVRVFHELGALAAICDENAATLQQLSDQFKVKSYQNASELIAESSVEAVAVAAPSPFHFPLGNEVLAAGKDLYMEKPLALSYAQGLELVSLAERKKKILMVGHILEYHPAIIALENLIQSQTLGKLFYIYSSRLNLGRVRREENILWSFAPHDLAVILRLIGEMPLYVSCTGGNYLNPNLADVTLTSLKFPSGIGSHLFVSWLHPFKEQKLIVAGSKKMAIFDDVVKEGKLKVLDRHIDWEKGEPKAKQGAEEIIPFSNEEPLKLELAHFLESISNRKPPLTTGKRALPVLKILEASQHSLSLGGNPVPIEEAAASRSAH